MRACVLWHIAAPAEASSRPMMMIITNALQGSTHVCSTLRMTTLRAETCDDHLTTYQHSPRLSSIQCTAMQKPYAACACAVLHGHDPYSSEACSLYKKGTLVATLGRLNRTHTPTYCCVDATLELQLQLYLNSYIDNLIDNCSQLFHQQHAANSVQFSRRLVISTCICIRRGGLELSALCPRSQLLCNDH